MPSYFEKKTYFDTFTDECFGAILLYSSQQRGDVNKNPSIKPRSIGLGQMKGLCGDHRKVENIPKKTPLYPLTKTESVLHCYKNEDLQSKSK